jgi:hypothetical protein
MPSAGFTMGGLIIDESSQTALDYCTVADVENYIGMDFTTSADGMGPTEAQIATMISNASRMIDTYAGRQIAGQLAVTEYFDMNNAQRHIVLGLRPVASITNAFTVNDSGTETTLEQGRVRNDDDYWLADQEAGIVRFHGAFQDDIGPASLKVVYISGETSAPADAKMATILWVVRAAARATLNDENCMERVKEMWSRLLKSTDSELDFWLRQIREDSPVGVATFGLKGAYGS